MSRIRTLIVALASLTALVLCFAGSASAEGVSCDRAVSPSGSDSAAGTLQAPYRSFSKLANSLTAGQTGCVRAGTYGNASDEIDIGARGSSEANRVTITGYPGEKATILGPVVALDTSRYLTIKNLYFNGKNTHDWPSPAISGDNITLANNDITNENTAICVHPAARAPHRPTDDIIENNRIHNCGQLPAANHDHGIYVLNSTNLTIRNNWIYDNADRGIQLYPDAQHTNITGNVIDSNGQGVAFGGDDGTASNNTTVSGNIITNSKLRNNVESWYPENNPTGTNNTVTNNCIHGSADNNQNGGIGTQRGFRARRNTAGKVRFRSRGRADYRLRGSSRCARLFSGAGTPGPGGHRAHAKRSKVTLRAHLSGNAIRLSGRVTGRYLRAGKRVKVLARSGSRTISLGSPRIRANGSFRLVKRLGGARAAGALRLRVKAPGGGRSRSVTVRS